MGKGKGKALNDRQRAFVEHYLTTWNASEAARRAGYKTKANVAGSDTLANPSVRAEIDARLSEMGMGANEVLARLTVQGRGDLRPFVDAQGGIDLSSAQAQDNLHLLKKVKSKVRHGTKEGGEEWEEIETDIEIHDPQAALVHLGRHWGLFLDKTVNGEDVYAEHMEKWKTAIQPK